MDKNTECCNPLNECIDLTNENSENTYKETENEGSRHYQYNKQSLTADRKHEHPTKTHLRTSSFSYLMGGRDDSHVDVPTYRKRKHEDEDEDTERKRLMANTQERARMRKINKALDDLRKVLPQEFSLYHRRMSKIRTLRLAMNYIKSLSDLIIQDNLRRNAQYNSTSGYMHPQYPDVPLTTPTSPEMETKVPYNMSPMSFATVIPFYPYLGPICVGFNPDHSPYHTPEQIPIKRPTNPRQLNFEHASKCEIHVPQPSCTDGIMETPVKRHRRYHFQDNTHSQRLHNKQADTRIKAETITSPLLGQRNPTEHDTSVLSSTSDSVADDMIEVPPLQTDGHIVPTGRTLAEILNDNEDD